MPCVSVRNISAIRANTKPYSFRELFRRFATFLKQKFPEQKPSNPKFLKQTSSTPKSLEQNPSALAPSKAQLSEGFIKIPHAPRQPFSHAAAQPAPTPVSARPNRFGPLASRLRSPGRTRAELINAESRLGSQLFGPIPAGHRREFFHDRDNVWIWHEDWTDLNADQHQLTVRYEVRPSGVYKKIAAGHYLRLEGDELENFRRAAHLYLALIKTHLYNSPH